MMSNYTTKQCSLINQVCQEKNPVWLWLLKHVIPSIGNYMVQGPTLQFLETKRYFHKDGEVLKSGQESDYMRNFTW